MPGRTSMRASRLSTAAVSHKSSAATLNGRGSTMSRASSAAIDMPGETPDNALRPQVASIFREAQRTTATHRKLAVTLRKMQEACCYEPTSATARSTVADFDEEDFNVEVVRCVLRVMPVKKTEAVGEKTIRFIGLFLRYSMDKDNEAMGEVDEDASTMPETPSTRLTAHLMDAIMPLLTAKDKFVRYRSTQLISHIVNSLDAIDDDLFQRLRSGLLKRIRDKEAMVRAQAVLGLGRLAGNTVEAENDSDDSDSGAAGSGLLEKLLDVLQNDPSADVRRSLLVNLPILPNTLPYLLERARDQDPLTRRAVYSRLLPALGDFRHLSLSMREKLLRWGLRDRDETVRKAAGRLFRERWIEDCAGVAPQQTVDGEQQPAEPAPVSFDGLLELLERIDVVNSGVDNGVALEAMKGFWEGRPDYREAVSLDDQFWETLSAESIFMARTFNDFCRSEGNGKYEYLVEEKLPEVTKVAFYLERYIKVLIDAMKRAAEGAGEDDEEEEDTVEQEFIVEQLLHIALTLDYSDEVGRRKMFALLRQALSIAELPDEVTKLTVEALRDLCAPDAAGEKEFCSVVLEAVADVHDTLIDDNEEADADPEESFHSAKSEVSDASASTRTGKQSKSSRGGSAASDASDDDGARERAIREIMINMKCLHIVQCMLTNVAGSLQHNDHLVAMLNNLVVPAVRSHEAPVRERGLVCLGLCSLLDRSLAEENLTLFMHFFSKGHAALQVTALHILTDILNVHGAHLLSQHAGLLKVYTKALRSGKTPPDVQAAAATAVCKLLLGRVVSDTAAAAELLRALVVAYFEPASATNQAVRQALNYALPVFCFSRVENQVLMGSVALDALHALHVVREGLEDDDDVDVGDDMVSLAAIGACLVDWTDPRKCFAADGAGEPGALEGDKRHVNGDAHLDLARDMLDRLDGNASREEKKAIAPLLGKLYVSPASSEDKLRDLYDDVSQAVDAQLVADATGRNALYKLHVSLGKIVNNLDTAQDGATVLAGVGRRSASRRTSMATSVAGSGGGDYERTVVGAADDRGDITATTLDADVIKEEEEEEEEGWEEAGDGASDGTVIHRDDGGEGDSLVDDLLTDGETRLG